jgi:hypothetical protein
MLTRVLLFYFERIIISNSWGRNAKPLNLDRGSKRPRNTALLMYVCRCTIYENDERYQLDATVLFIIINNSICFEHLYAHLQEYIGCILLHMVFSTRC